MSAPDIESYDVTPILPEQEVEWGEWEDTRDGKVCLGTLDIGDHTAAVSVTVPKHGPALVEPYWYGDAGELPLVVAQHMRAEGRIKATEI